MADQPIQPVPVIPGPADPVATNVTAPAPVQSTTPSSVEPQAAIVAPVPAPTQPPAQTSATSPVPAAPVVQQPAQPQPTVTTTKSAPAQDKAPQSVDQTLEKINRGFKERATIEKAKQLNMQYINIS